MPMLQTMRLSVREPAVSKFVILAVDPDNADVAVKLLAVKRVFTVALATRREFATIDPAVIARPVSRPFIPNDAAVIPPDALIVLASITLLTVTPLIVS